MPALSQTSPSSHQPPPPSLFLGPPSRDASRVSLPTVLLPDAPTSGVGAPTASTTKSSDRLGASNLHQPRPRLAARAGTDIGTSAFSRTIHDERQQQQAVAGQKQADHTEALWAEMQLTLEEVELNAANEAHVFGAEHAKALEALRAAQIALAQAWGRNEADDDDDEANAEPGSTTQSRPVTSDGTTAAPDADPAQMEDNTDDEAEKDFVLARKRREANDRYFERVNEGVRGVVAKLEDVATAMRMVEQESRDIWSDSGGSRNSSIG
ncbi:MAG: hypothetical protein M1826_001498 [Phylliscum demangeonii]|nr:MAG: hypothetical protein M1826_001498 [Phylliscum demangeonii]